jgi:hypothetical protein
VVICVPAARSHFQPSWRPVGYRVDQGSGWRWAEVRTRHTCSLLACKAVSRTERPVSDQPGLHNHFAGAQLGQDPAVAGRSGGGAIPLASGVEACRSSSPNALVIERSAVVTSLGMTQNVLPELWASWGRVWRYW